jgi:glucose/arabinose dehydrogenase
MDVRRIVMLACLFTAVGLGLAGSPAGSAAGGARSIGPAPALPPPERQVFPTVYVAPAVGWPAGAAPVPAPGLRVTAFATGLDHPRSLLVLPNGDVLVAETKAPPRPADAEGLRGWLMKRVSQRAGAAGPSANRITLLRDADGDGIAELRATFLSGLNSPFGMALVGSELFVANTDAVLRFPYTPGATSIATPPRKLIDLPAGPRNHHWTRNLVASPDGRTLFVTVGANSNAAEHGLAEETGRAAIWAVDIASGRYRLFATGLRNPVGLDFNPDNGALWTVVNERDGMGPDLVPDYLAQVVDSGFYGWPYSYFGTHVDENVQPQRPDLVAFARTPDYALGAHVGALGLAFSAGNALSATFQQGAFISQHGSWNRKPRSGYNVVFVPFRNGRPAGMPVELLGGFVSAEGKAFGRPAGVALHRGGLLVADDVGNAVWRVEGASAPAAVVPEEKVVAPPAPPLAQKSTKPRRKAPRKAAASTPAADADAADDKPTGVSARVAAEDSQAPDDAPDREDSPPAKAKGRAARPGNASASASESGKSATRPATTAKATPARPKRSASKTASVKAPSGTKAETPAP